MFNFLVILDSSGFSKGYGFVKFGLEEEQQDALHKMNGYIGLGSKPIRICNAVPKPKDGSTPTTPISTPSSLVSGYIDYNPYQYDSSSAYWQNYNWQSYYDQSQDYSGYQLQSWQGQADYSGLLQQQEEDDELALVEHKTIVDTDKWNNEANERDCNLWDALERSKWLPIEQLEIATSS